MINMGFKDALIAWIFKNARIPTPVLKDVIDQADRNNDEYIDLAEFVQALKDAWDHVKNK